MTQLAKKAQQAQDVLIQELEPVIQQQTGPFDAYKLARGVKHAPMAIGRALQTLCAQGVLKALGEAPEGHLAERYIHV